MATLIKVGRKSSFDPNLTELKLDWSPNNDNKDYKYALENIHQKEIVILTRKKTLADEHFTPEKEGIEETVKKVRLDGVEAWSMSTTKAGKIFWTIFICTACAVTIFYLYKTIYEYWSSTPVTTFSIRPMTKMDFPHVCICPNVQYSGFEFAGDQTQESDNTISEAFTTGQFFHQNGSLCKNRSKFHYQKEDIGKIFIKCTLRKFSHNQDIPCSSIVRSITDVDTQDNCFVVKFYEEKQRISGRGLLLAINQSRLSFDTCTAARGLKVVVAKSYTFGSYDSTFVVPGTFTDLNLKAQYYHFENVRGGPNPQPCVSPDETRLTYLAGNYTRRSCLKECELNAIFHTCGCLPKMDDYFLKEHTPAYQVCEVTQMEDCLKEVKKESNLEVCQSRCYESCRVWRYPVQASFQPLNAKKFNNNDSHNLIYLHVAFGQMEIDEYVQSPSATVDGMISNIGGQVNLWLGASMVTLIQIPTLFSVIVAWSLYGNVQHVQYDRSKFTEFSNKLLFWKK